MDRPPPSFDEDEAYAWCEWVLDHGLPELPDTFAKGEAVPIARWIGPEFGAVLRTEWSWSDEPRSDRPDALWSVVQMFRRTATGWEGSSGDGGGGWYDPPFQPPTIGSREVQTFGAHSSGGDGWRGAARFGRVGSDIAFAELATGDRTVRQPIESPIGAVIVAFDPSLPCTFRYIAHDGTAAEVVNFDPATDWA